MEQLSELRRSTTDGRVAGVCVMLADRWHVDPLLVRVAALLLALSSGIGVVLYAAAWALIPPEGSDRAPIDAVFPGVRKLGRTAGITLLVVVCIFAAALVSHVLPFGIGPALVIGAVWYFGWYRPEQRRRTLQPRAPEPDRLAARPFADETPFTQAAAAWQRRMQEYLQDRAAPSHSTPPTTAHDPGYSLQAFLAHPDPVGLFSPDRQFPPDRQPCPTPQPIAEAPSTETPPMGAAPSGTSPERARRRTGRMHLIGWALTLILVGTVAVLGRSFDLPPYAIPAAALLAVGVTLVVGGWLPRPRGLVLVGVLLAIVTGVGAAPLQAPPTTTVTYSSVAELPAGIQQEDMGTIVADLSGLRLDRDATYAVGVDVGRIVVQVPADTNVRVVWSVEAGDARVLGRNIDDGLELRDTMVARGADPGGPTLTIEAHVGLGRLEVER